ncbi:Protein of unknown function [Leuconostoc citreum]|nr:Protein of unknown function [Leuconostoc citreum LBAE C10]CCF26576.1 Protein of unknown function [Leuconostoc citreum LBAE C11]CCF29084.1 Protein of unknown function [Leuconostoc citreum LBAE E16]CDX65510.1 Protein of unknown function [Leuconostoc citreum]
MKNAFAQLNNAWWRR